MGTSDGAAPKAPARNDELRRAALQHANETRQRRAALKRAVREGAAKATRVVAAPPPWAGTMRAAELVQAVPRMGPERTRLLLQQCGISTSKTLAALTDRQREQLIAALAARSRESVTV